MIQDPPESSTQSPSWKSDPNMEGFRLRVMSMNIWALPVAPLCETRVHEIGNALKEDQWDVVVFQEVWYRRERNILIQSGAQAGFSYYHYFKSAVGFPLPLGHDGFSTGLVVLSKYPITEALYYRFTLSGRVYALHESDYLASKGAGLVRIQTPAAPVDLYCTHLLANYNYLGAPGDGDRYFAHRAAQSYELTRFIEATAKSSLVLLCGDMNSPSDCLCLRIPQDLFELRDTYADIHSDEGITFAGTDNRYSHGDHPMRMDYILYKNSTRWWLQESQVYKQFFTASDGENYPVSDHFGVSCEFYYGTVPPKTLSSPAKTDQQRPRKCSVHGELDALSIDVAPVDDSPTECLNELLKTVQLGHLQTVTRRIAHFRRAAITFTLLLFAVACCSLYRLEISLSITLGLAILVLYLFVELLLAQVAVTWECGSFAEIVSQVHLHLFRVDKMSSSL